MGETDGHLIACPGPSIDFGTVEQTIRDLAAEYDIKRFCSTARSLAR